MFCATGERSAVMGVMLDMFVLSMGYCCSKPITIQSTL